MKRLTVSYNQYRGVAIQIEIFLTRILSRAWSRVVSRGGHPPRNVHSRTIYKERTWSGIGRVTWIKRIYFCIGPSYPSVSLALCGGAIPNPSLSSTAPPFRKPPSVFFFLSAGSRDRSHSETNPTNSNATTPCSEKELVIESTIIVRRPSAFSIYVRARARWTGWRTGSCSRTMATHTEPRGVHPCEGSASHRSIAETKSRVSLIWRSAPLWLPVLSGIVCLFCILLYSSYMIDDSQNVCFLAS